MNTLDEVETFLANQPEPKQSELRAIHARILAEHPGCRVWFADGVDEHGKVVANPSIGYGAYVITYANGSEREFYRVGLSANSTGISVYVMGLEDKTFLARTFGPTLGKATVTGYCIKFRRLEAIDADVLHAAIHHGLALDERPPRSR